MWEDFIRQQGGQQQAVQSLWKMLMQQQANQAQAQAPDYRVPNPSNTGNLHPPNVYDGGSGSSLSLEGYASSPQMSGKVFDRSRTAVDPYDFQGRLTYRGEF